LQPENLLQMQQQPQPQALAARKSVADAAAAAAAGAKVVVTYFPQQWSKKYALSVTSNDMLTMEDGKWMNDVVVEFGIHVIVDNELSEDIYFGTCFVMSTFFSEKLRTVLLTATNASIVTNFELCRVTDDVV
jgi:Ulp1 family protease